MLSRSIISRSQSLTQLIETQLRCRTLFGTIYDQDFLPFQKVSKTHKKFIFILGEDGEVSEVSTAITK